jgi:hypothetical protein
LNIFTAPQASKSAIGVPSHRGDILKSCKLSWILVAVLSVVVAALGYKFTVGNVRPSDDGRQAVMLSKDERNALLLEMRVWLQSSQGILAAASAKDFDAVIKSAKASGMGAEAILMAHYSGNSLLR